LGGCAAEGLEWLLPLPKKSVSPEYVMHAAFPFLKPQPGVWNMPALAWRM
jgi:hypothetical protein